MSELDTMQHELSDRIWMLTNTFRKAREGYVSFDHQSSKTFLAMLEESYEDALLLEAAISVRPSSQPGNQVNNVVKFPKPKLVVDSEQGAE